MVQTELVRDMLMEKFPDVEIEIIPMSTKGDKLLDRSLTSFGGKGVFTKELEDALLKGEIDLAVHSAKDMPMEFPKGLAMGAVLEREEPADVLVTLDGTKVKDFPAGSVIGTSSLRRELQIKHMNPQVRVKLLRGNVQTRIGKLQNGEYDGILLAAAGLKRLGMEQPEDFHLEYLDKELFIPAAGQGILALEIRQGELKEIMAALHSAEAAAELMAEREYLTILGGSCNAPCGAYCRREKDQLVMTAMYAPDGVHPIFRKGSVALDAVPEDEAKKADYLLTKAKELADQLAIQVRFKTVSLVGAGPGDEGLFTRKGLECVRKADVIVYDNLICGSILNEARLDAELIYAGKRSNHHHLTQDQINELLVKEAMLGKYVVRLKGGDPYIFGRGGEEALELKRYGIPFEIVPGVSSSYSVPSYAGIPVTQRELASSFHVITGHEGAHKETEVLDYATLAKEEGTLIFLMGLKNLPRITQQLIAHGKDKNTPAAVIQQGTTAKQKKAVSTLEHIVEEAERCKIKTPAITVVGSVVGLEEKLDWFGRGSLFGKRVLITGTRYIAKELEEELRPLGAETITLSLIESRPLWTEEIRQALEQLERYQWMVFTSSNGVDIFFEVLKKQEIDLRRLMNLKFAAIGRKTAAALKEHGFQCDFVPESFSGTNLAKEWIPTLKQDERVLMLRAKDGSEVLPEKLKEAGIPFADIPLYETWVDERRKEELNRIIQEVDYVTIASGSAAKALCNLLDETEGLAAKVISIGPFTTKAAESRGLSVYADAVEYTAAGMAAVILADVEEITHYPRVIEDAGWENEKFASAADKIKAEKNKVESELLDADGDSHDEAKEPAAYFPLFFNMEQQKVLLVGAGKIASRRAAALAEFGAEILVVAPDGAEQMECLEREGKVRWERRPFAASDLQGQYLVLTATNDAGLNAHIAQLCHEQKILFNHAGDKSQCDFYFPGIAREDGLVAGVTASGRDHKLASHVTGRLQEWLKQFR